MAFTNFQIITIFISFLLAFITAIFWQIRDKSIDNKENQESFATLMSVFFWSCLLGFFLKLILNFLYNINFIYYNAYWFTSFTLFLEEFVKAFAIIV